MNIGCASRERGGRTASLRGQAIVNIARTAKLRAEGQEAATHQRESLGLSSVKRLMSVSARPWARNIGTIVFSKNVKPRFDRNQMIHASIAQHAIMRDDEAISVAAAHQL